VAKKGKEISGHFVRSTTPVKYVRLGKAYCIAFDFGKRSMVGIAVEDSQSAMAIADYFRNVQVVLKAHEDKEKEEIERATT